MIGLVMLSLVSLMVSVSILYWVVCYKGTCRGHVPGAHTHTHGQGQGKGAAHGPPLTPPRGQTHTQTLTQARG